MKKIVANFFEGKSLPIVEIIKRGKTRGLHASQIEEGMEVVYEKRDTIKDINLVRAVWNEARSVKGEQYVIAKGIIDRLRGQIKDLKFKMHVLLGVYVVTTLVFAYILYVEGYFSW